MKCGSCTKRRRTKIFRFVGFQSAFSINRELDAMYFGMVCRTWNDKKSSGLLKNRSAHIEMYLYMAMV